MPEYKNIVYATDFSEHANRAFEEAKYVAGITGGTLHVLHVVPGSGAKTGGSEPETSGSSKLVERYPAEGAEYAVLHGNEAAAIIGYADSRPGSVIVIGSRGIGVITGLFGGGSICDKVVANASSPVLVVPGE